MDLSNPWDMPEYHKIADFFELDETERRNPQVAEKLSWLADWGFDMTRSDNITDALHSLKALKSFMGINSKGFDLVNKMHMWARLDTRRREIQKEMELIHET